ncbi:hypothetical protein [Nitrosovibrio tenuis]|nr:hypothetical protein [Nitrosovibrio tenuis]
MQTLGEHAKGYGAGNLPAVQRLQSKTSPLAAHRKPMTHQSSVYSPPGQRIGSPSYLPERMLLRRAISPLATGPHERLTTPQRHHASPEVAYSRDSLLPTYISRRAIMARSEGPATSDHAAILHATHVWRRVAQSQNRSPAPANDRIGNPEPAIADSVPAIAADIRSNPLLPANTANREMRATRLVDIAPIVRSHPLSISVRRSPSNTVRPSAMQDSYDHADGALRVKPLASPYSMARRAIGQSAEQQRLSVSSGRGFSTPKTYAPDNRDYAFNPQINLLQTKWKSGPGGRPLVAQRVQDRLMRLSSEGAGAGAGASALATPDRPEDRYGLASPSSEPVVAQVIPASESKKTPESKPGQLDADETVEQAWRIMTERLVIEQERRGLAKWP